MADQAPTKTPVTDVISGPWTLIGSARFEKAYHDWSRWLAFAGHPCFSLACFPSQMEEMGGKDWYTPAQKAMLDHVHLRKIDMSQVVLVLNVGGYIGGSTIQEMLYAITKGKAVFSIEPFKNKAVKLSDRAIEFSSYMEDSPTELYRVVGADLEKYIVKASTPKAEPEVAAKSQEPAERTAKPSSHDEDGAK